MKFLVLSFLLAALLALTAAMPTTELLEEEQIAEEVDTAEYVTPEEHGVRMARATCDLLSMSTPWGSANHSICAAHCLTMGKGFRGGRCKDGICHCRK